jgi:hypothetical protein
VPAPDLATLCTFRADLHACFFCHADALFEVIDTLLTAGPVTSLVHVRLQAAHCRGWGNLYDVLAEGALDEAALQGLLMRHAVSYGPAIYALDQGVWTRCDAETSPGRGFYNHPWRHSVGQPIVAGGPISGWPSSA